MHRIRVLIADDDVHSARLLSESLAQEGCFCEVASNGDMALRIVQSQICDVVICDASMEAMSQFGLLGQIKATQPNLPVIVGTSDSSILDAVEAVKHGAFQYIEKPFDIGKLLVFIIQAIAESHQYRRTTTTTLFQNIAAIPNCDLVQASPLMRELVASIALAARSNAAVLILGESGTGKERAARSIHGRGLRASQPFIPVNTSAIPEQLLESEVFGHVRGSFTGATQARRGLLLEANGGTMLLDEIGDMPIALQPKLLRVLQFGEIRPVGSDRIGHVDVRIIAATHRNLSVLVHEGRFREDLHYRLNVIPLVVPPLRERREDILPLADRFLQEARARTVDSPVDSISDEAMNVLTQGAWPGNVRELENAIERVVVLGREATVIPRDFAFLNTNPPEAILPAVDSPVTLKEMNQRYLDWVLIRTGGDKRRAARILDINLTTLYRWEHTKH